MAQNWRQNLQSTVSRQFAFKLSGFVLGLTWKHEPWRQAARAEIISLMVCQCARVRRQTNLTRKFRYSWLASLITWPALMLRAMPDRWDVAVKCTTSQSCVRRLTSFYWGSTMCVLNMWWDIKFLRRQTAVKEGEGGKKLDASQIYLLFRVRSILRCRSQEDHRDMWQKHESCANPERSLCLKLHSRYWLVNLTSAPYAAHCEEG